MAVPEEILTAPEPPLAPSAAAADFIVTLPLGNPEPEETTIAPPVAEELSPPFSIIEPPLFCDAPTDKITLPETEPDVPDWILISPESPCALPEATAISPLLPAAPD